MTKRSRIISWILSVASALAIIAWAIGSRIESPADAAARTAPPIPSAILVPIELRELSSNIVTRGKARFWFATADYPCTLSVESDTRVDYIAAAA